MNDEFDFFDCGDEIIVGERIRFKPGVYDPEYARIGLAYPVKPRLAIVEEDLGPQKGLRVHFSRDIARGGEVIPYERVLRKTEGRYVWANLASGPCWMRSEGQYPVEVLTPRGWIELRWKKQLRKRDLRIMA